MNFFSIGSYLFGADKKKVVIQPSTTLLNFSDEKDEMQSLNSEKDNQNHHDKHWSRKRCIQNYGSDYSESNSDKSNTKSISANKSQKKKRSCGLVNSDYELSRNCYASDVPNSSESDSDDDLTEKHIMNHDVVDFNDDRDFNHGILLNIFKGDFVHIKANMDSKRNNEVLKAVLLKSIKDYSHLNKLLSLVIIEYFLYHFQPSLVALKGNWPNLLNSLGNMLIDTMKLEQGHAKHNFSRRVYTQTAKLADTIILIHYCIASNKSKCFDSIPIIWRPLLEYILDSSRSNEFRYLFVARYSMENKNRKLPTRLKEYDCKFKMIDVNLFIKNSCQDLGTFREVQLIFESVFSSKKANRLWKHATSDGIKKDLRNYANDNLRRRNLLNSCKMNEIERVNEDIGEHEDDIGIAESENRLAERYRHNILFFDEMVETIISIDLSSYKACYEKNKIVNMELKDLFRLCDSQKFGNYEIIYDDITKIAKHSSEMLASTNSYNERTNQNLVSKHCFFQKDIKNSHLSQIGQIVLLFSRKLAVKLSLEVLGDQLEQREYYETLLNNNLVAFDIFPAGCIEQDPHWDFELPKDLLDDERFYGASVILNSTAINQELQIHMWDECEYDSACLTLTVFNRKPYSITLMDARLLHNEPINTRKHSIYHMSLYLSPLDSNNTPPRTALKFVSDIERRSGISIEYKICGENLTINKKRVKPGTLTDSIVLKNLRENLHTHLKDIEVDIIDQHIKSFVNNLEKTFIRK